MTINCKSKCENTKQCSLKYSHYADKCPCNSCLVKTMCGVACKAYSEFRIFVININNHNEKYDLYKITKKYEFYKITKQ